MAKKEPKKPASQMSPFDAAWKRPTLSSMMGRKVGDEFTARIQFDPAKQERENHQLRGCMDPGCSICNPETASMAANNPFIVTTASQIAAYRRALEARGSLSVEDFEGLITTVRVDNSERKVPPASYTKARGEVEKWLQITSPTQTFGDIIGNEEALAQLRDAIEAPVKHKELYKAYGLKMPKGALLSGPPGCGKTMFARAAAHTMRELYGDGGEFILVSGADLQSPYVGFTEAYIKSIFTFAKEFKAYHGRPLLVFMDEAEVMLPDRTGRVRRVAMWEESQVATFLAEMDGMNESGAFVLLASNCPWKIDEAVLRDGRCDFKIEVKRPTQEAIETILRRNFEGKMIAEGDVDTMVFTAMECLYDPHKVLIYAHALGLNIEKEKVVHLEKHFLLEHIISGAMAVSIPSRAMRFAFNRDKVDGVPRGLIPMDVVNAVGRLFDENKGLEHSFALNEFKAEFMKEIEAKEKE